MSGLDEKPVIETAHDVKCLAIRFLFGEISRTDYQKEFYRLVQDLQHSNSQHAVLRRGKNVLVESESNYQCETL